MKTVLTDEQEAQFVAKIIEYGTEFVAPLFSVVTSIEQAVLKSPEIQALRKDAERYRYARDNIMEDHELPGGYYLSDEGEYKDRYPGGIPVITIDQAESYKDACVREALTEVAEMCDNVFSFSVGDSVRDLMYKMLSENNTTGKC